MWREYCHEPPAEQRMMSDLYLHRNDAFHTLVLIGKEHIDQAVRAGFQLSSHVPADHQAFYVHPDDEATIPGIRPKLRIVYEENDVVGGHHSRGGKNYVYIHTHSDPPIVIGQIPVREVGYL